MRKKIQITVCIEACLHWVPQKWRDQCPTT